MSASTTLERVLACTAIPALAELHPDDLASLAERAQERRSAPGEPFTASGQVAVSLLLDGALEVGLERRRVEAPALVGAVEALAGAALPARAGDAGAQGLTLDHDAFTWVLSDVYEIWVAMLRHAAARWLAAEPDVAEAARAATPSALDTGVGHGGRTHDTPSPLATRIRLLSATELLGSLRAGTLGRLACAVEELALAPESALWQSGSPCDDCFVVVEGTFAHRAGSDLETLHGRAGTVLGLREALARSAHESEIVARCDARVLRLSCGALLDELEDDPDAAEALLRTLGRRVLQAEARLHEGGR